jgi:hypothetical protein
VAISRLREQGGFVAKLGEMTSYHNNRGTMVTAAFIPRLKCPVTTFVLTQAQQDIKRKLFDCFTTQRRMLDAFDIRCERFRPAPKYDFTQPPHAGVPFYEMLEWGMTGKLWRKLAKEALGPLVASL